MKKFALQIDGLGTFTDCTYEQGTKPKQLRWGNFEPESINVETLHKTYSMEVGTVFKYKDVYLQICKVRVECINGFVSVLDSCESCYFYTNYEVRSKHCVGICTEKRTVTKSVYFKLVSENELTVPKSNNNK